MRLGLNKKFNKIRLILRYLFIFSGIILLVMVIYAFTSGPFWQYYHLGTKNIDYSFTPDYIILLGGSGMPSESNLIRSYYASKIGHEIPCVPIIVALPGDTADSTSSVMQLADDLIQRGIQSNRILFESEGINTRAQVLNIKSILKNLVDSVKIVIVTSPEHMRRSLLCFRKAGFKFVGGYPAFEYAIESDLTVEKRDLGGRKYVPDINNSISLRYRFWVHLKYEITILREYIALTYYKVKGWI